MDNHDFSVEELDSQHSAILPGRQLLVAVSLLGIPLVGLDGVNVNVDTKGPNWLGSVGQV